MALTGVKGFHLSMQQAHVWSLQGDDKQVYATQCAIHISGALDLEVFLQAVQWVVNRHSILRTSFFRFPGMDVPVQVIDEQGKVDCVIIDVEHLHTEAQTFPCQTGFPLFHNESVDLTHGPLLHLSILRLSRDAHILHLSVPSLCADERTLLLFVTELSQAYALPSREESSAEDVEEPIQYIDAAAWQDELLLEEEVEHHRHYWRKMDLAQGVTHSFPVPKLVREVAHEEYADAFNPLMLDVPIDAIVLAQINQLTEQLHISLPTYILSCWYVSCLKLTHTTTMMMGISCDGRFHEELQSALVLYKRFVPLTITLSDEVPFEQVLLLMQATVAETYEEQLYFSWEESLARTKETVPYFPVSFEYERWPATLHAGALTFSLLQCWSCTEPFVLKLSARQVGERLQLELYYDPQQVSSEQVRSLATLFGTLLVNATAQPQTRVGMLSLLSSAERRHLLTTFSAPQRSWPEQSLHQLFEGQVRRQPGALAVISYQAQMTYQQLNVRANQLAYILRQRGVGPNVLVGLCLSRQASMLVGLLGILKAGGAYLPLDASNPPARLSYQLQESGARLLLTQEEQRSSLPDWAGNTLYLEDLEGELAQASGENQATGSIGEDLAYVIYTSGSTGAPKGVMVRQSSVVNYTQALCQQLAAQPGWQYATVSTLAADLGNTAIFCALASGGCVQVLDYELVTSGEAMANWATQHPIDVLKIVPSHLSALLESTQAQTVLPRRALVLGGEALSVRSITTMDRPRPPLAC